MQNRGVKRGLAFVLLFSVLSLLSLANIDALSSDVAYILQNDRTVKSEVLDVFDDLGLSVDIIEDNDVLRYNLNNYRLIFVDDARLRKTKNLAIYNYPSVIMNKYYGKEWGLTDNDGISQLASTAPLNVKVDSSILQVYTQAKYTSSVSIPYYYLEDLNKAPGMSSIARTYTGDSDNYDFGDVISVAPEGTRLANGRISGGKICFYGIAKTPYWTTSARNLFIDCVESVLIQCERNSDCDDSDDYTQDICINPGTIDSYCEYNPIECLNENDCGTDGPIDEVYCNGISRNDVYRDYVNYTCNNPGTVDSYCSNITEPHIVEECIDICVNGACVDVECYNNTDCGTDGFVTDNYCNGISGNGVYGDYMSFICNAPGTALSYCSNNTIPQLIEQCDEYCLDGECVGITCYNDIDCDDSDNYTQDICVNPGTPASRCEHNPIECFRDEECGIDSVSDNYCNGLGGKDVYRNITDFRCINPGTPSSLCTMNNIIELVEECSDICINGECVNINCFTDDDCNDSNPRTVDQCVNAGTIASYCINTEVNCLEDLDCGITGFVDNEFCLLNDIYKYYQNSSCLNPGTLNSNCVVEKFPVMLNDCGENSCDNWGENYCIGDDVYHSRLCHNRGCSNQNPIVMCIDDIYEENELVEECDFGCANGNCLPPECVNDSDCPGDMRWLNNYCVGDDLWSNYSIPSCINFECGIGYQEVFNKTCDYGCANGDCLEGVHDVAIDQSLTNSIGGIRIEYINGTDILGDAILICNENYKVVVNVLNLGNFYENVTFNGNVDGLSFNHLPKDNLAPSDSSLKTKTVNFSLADGFYNISVNAIIPIDNNPLNNFAQRQIEIVCEEPPPIECYNDEGCGDEQLIGNYCYGNDLWGNYSIPICLNPGTINSECSFEHLQIFNKTCDYGCANGDCLGYIECSKDSDCDDGLYCNGIEKCDLDTNTCYSGVPVNCNDNLQCTVNSCNEELDRCETIPENSLCDDGLFCNGIETCNVNSGCQRGVRIDCSGNNLEPIATCEFSPDGNPLTLDYFPGFVSMCDEARDSCTLGTIQLNHECSINECGAFCETNERCIDSSCSETYNDYCYNLMLVEYDNDKILDSTTITNSIENNCIGCQCEENIADCSAPETNEYCVVGICNAECDSNDDCPATDCDYLDGCVRRDYYDYADTENNCMGCGCEENQCSNPIISYNDERCVEITCYNDEDCGIDDWIGAVYCSKDDIYQNWRDYTCVNPGTTTSYCDINLSSSLRQDCGEDGCNEWQDWYCTSNIERKRDRKCYDRGCLNSNCFEDEIIESQTENCPQGQKCEGGDCINIDINNPPKIKALIPLSGISCPKKEVMFLTVYSDEDGADDIKYSHLAIGDKLFTTDIVLGYNENTDKIWTVDDNGNWVGEVTPGIPTILENSKFSVNIAGVSVIKDGKELKIVWPIVFKENFVGEKKTYMYVQDEEGEEDGWREIGEWNIEIKPKSVFIISHDDNGILPDSQCPAGYVKKGGIHVGKGNNNIYGEDYQGNQIKNGWLTLCSVDDSALFVNRYTPWPENACPSGYTRKGGILVGGRSRLPIAEDYLGNYALGSAWSELCVKNEEDEILYINHYDDCSLSYPEICPDGYQITGKAHPYGGSCGGSMEQYNYQDVFLDSGWIGLCSRSC